MSAPSFSPAPKRVARSTTAWRTGATFSGTAGTVRPNADDESGSSRPIGGWLPRGPAPQTPMRARSGRRRAGEPDRDALEAQPAEHPLEHRLRVALGAAQDRRVAARRLGELLL